MKHFKNAYIVVSWEKEPKSIAKLQNVLKTFNSVHKFIRAIFFQFFSNYCMRSEENLVTFSVRGTGDFIPCNTLCASEFGNIAI